MKIKMTIDECLEFADEWARGCTFHEGSQGWRVVCMLLADGWADTGRMMGEWLDANKAANVLADRPAALHAAGPESEANGVERRVMPHG